MKKNRIALQNTALLAMLVAIFISCEKDYSSIETGVINPDNATSFSTGVEAFTVTASTRDVTPMQTNGLSAHMLGYNNDAVYGSSKANFVSQMTPSQFDPIFGDNVELDSVILTIPYFSYTNESDEDNNPIYELDSVYGSEPIKLSIYRNNYFLKDYDPVAGFNEPQLYYSNGAVSKTEFINPSDLEGELIVTLDEFAPSSDVIILTELDEEGEPIEKSRITPSLRVRLDDPEDPTYWEDLIFNKEGGSELSNSNNFNNYFRGLFFKTEALGPDGTLMMLDFSSTTANIKLYYKVDGDVDPEDTDSETPQDVGEYTLSFNGNQITFFEDNLVDVPETDEKLYLKGGVGSMAVINLFNGDEDGNSAELDEFKAKNWLINEAILTFYVDQDMIQEQEPDRVYIYDINNNAALIDFALDQSQSVSGATIFPKTNHLEPLIREDDDDPKSKGVKYKIRIKEHLNNIILRDSTNVKLGLVVTSNVIALGAMKVLDQDDIFIPTGSVLTPRGTVLHGSNSPNIEKRVTFEIYYTEPDEN